MPKTTHKEYLALCLQDGKWVNAKVWKLFTSDRVCKTKEEAQYYINAMLEKFNKPFQYNAQGKRYESDGLVQVECYKDVDVRLRVTETKIRVREVTDWDDVTD